MRRTPIVPVVVAAATVLVAGTGATYAVSVDTPHLAGSTAVRPATPKPPTKEQIAALFDRWNAALATGDANRVADLYARDAVLLPTVSSRIRTNRAEIVDYFQHFLQSKPSGRIQQRIINIPNAGTAIDTGLYQFTLTGKDGVKSTVNARYTYVYQLQAGKWLIVNHHSSVVPSGA